MTFIATRYTLQLKTIPVGMCVNEDGHIIVLSVCLMLAFGKIANVCITTNLKAIL